MDKLTEWLELTGMSRAELAAEIGVTRQAVHYWLAGERYPDGVSIRKIHELTRIPLDDLVPRVDAA